MKAKYLLLGLFLLSLISSACAVRAADYSLGVKEGDEAVYVIKTLDEDTLEDIGLYVVDPDMEEGAKMKNEVTDTGESGDFFTVDIDQWDWTTGDFAEDPDASGTIYIPKDPKDAAIYVLLGVWILPTPVDDYLSNVDWGADEDDVDVSGTTVTWTAEDGTITVSYDSSTGALSNFKIADKDGNVALEIALETAIPGYELTVLLGMSALTAIGLIYAVMKRK